MAPWLLASRELLLRLLCDEHLQMLLQVFLQFQLLLKFSLQLLYLIFATWLLATWLMATWLLATWLLATWLMAARELRVLLARELARELLYLIFAIWLLATWLLATWLMATWLLATRLLATLLLLAMWPLVVEPPVVHTCCNVSMSQGHASKELLARELLAS